MSRTKIDYGIDLGTTNSAIARMENGEPTIIKSKRFGMDTTPSCVWFNRKGSPFVGTKSKDELGSERIAAFSENNKELINAFEEFKRTMGSDIVFDCINTGKSYTSEELSAEVLKALKGYIQDEDVNSIVITIPDRFEQHSVDATQRAAELAGLQYCELLSEPAAASTAFGMDAQSKNGLWLVFDFGGGTFDVVIMKSNDGIVDQVGSSGDNKLGGKDIDEAIIDNIILPHIEENYTIDQILLDEKRKNLLRNAFKKDAEEIKINLSSKDDSQFDYLTNVPIGEDDNGNEIDFELTVTKEKFEEIAKPNFQRAIDITNKLLKEKKLTGKDLTTILMIGGTTFSNTLRDMVQKQISPNINTSIDPMTAVSKGAALFASTKNIPSGVSKVDKSKIQLKLMYEPDNVEEEAKVGIRVLRDKTEGEIPDNYFIELNRQDNGWSSGKLEIKGDSEIFEVKLEQGKSNGFSITITNEKGVVFPSEPATFSILGIKVPTAKLPYDLCVDAFEFEKGKQHLIPIKGLEEGVSLPAKGDRTFKTIKEIRPGNKQDELHIGVYNGKPRTNKLYANHAGTAIIKDFPGFLPKESDIEISLEVDSSRRIKLTATFPTLDEHTHEEEFEHFTQPTPDIGFLETEMNNIGKKLGSLEEDFEDLDTISIEKIRSNINEVSSLFESGKSDEETRIRLLERLREINKKIEKLQEMSEWPKAMQELTDALDTLDSTIEKSGNEEAKSILSQYNGQVELVIEKQDLKMAEDLTQRIIGLKHEIIRQEYGPAYWISYIKSFDDDFDMHDWKNNKSQARQLINEAKRIINANRATEDNLRPIVGQLFQLLPMAPSKPGEGPSEDSIGV